MVRVSNVYGHLLTVPLIALPRWGLDVVLTPSMMSYSITTSKSTLGWVSLFEFHVPLFRAFTQIIFYQGKSLAKGLLDALVQSTEVYREFENFENVLRAACPSDLARWTEIYDSWVDNRGVDGSECPFVDTSPRKCLIFDISFNTHVLFLFLSLISDTSFSEVRARLKQDEQDDPLSFDPSDGSSASSFVSMGLDLENAW
jgi:hypothetical protein